jgi:membrane-anchored glycerophosphoryl diester phosphodiesterase (GDPDase)
MRFSMSTAWNDAMALMRGNREVLAVVAGVFFLLPTLVMAVVFAEEQAQAMAVLQAMVQGQVLQEQPEMALQAAPGWFVAVGFCAFFIQLLGYLALLALMDDRRRPTVGEAIGTAFKCLLPLIGAVILFIVGYIVCAIAVSLVFGVLGALLGAISGAVAGLFGILAAIALIVGVFYVMVRLSLTLADIVLGDKMNPISAFAGSWRLTKGNSFRLFLFYLLLTIVYVVINMVIFGVLMGALSVALPGTAGGLVLGIVSGLIGALFGVIWTAVLAAVYRQLSGPSAHAVSEAFE